MLNQLFGRLPEVTTLFPTSTYLAFIAPAVTVVGVLPSALICGARLDQDRETGFLEHLLAAPVARGSILAGSALAAMAGSLLTGVCVMLAGRIGGLHVYALRGVLAALAMSATLCACFFGLSVVLAILVRQRALLHWLQGAALAASVLVADTILPASALPAWIGDLSVINPVRYAVHGARVALAGQPDWTAYFQDLSVVSCLALLSIVAAYVTFRFGADL